MNISLNSVNEYNKNILEKISRNEELDKSLQLQLINIKNIIPDSYKGIILNACGVDLKSENNKRIINNDGSQYKKIISGFQQKLEDIRNNKAKQSKTENKSIFKKNKSNLNSQFAPRKTILANSAAKHKTSFNIETKLDDINSCLDRVIKKQESLQCNINELIKLEQSLATAKKLSDNEDEIIKLTLDKKRVLKEIVENCQEIISVSIEVKINFTDLNNYIKSFSMIDDEEVDDSILKNNQVFSADA